MKHLYGHSIKQETAFNKVISLDPEFTGARINLGNLQFLKENYSKAVESYAAVIEKLEEKGRSESSTALKVLINLARASYMLEQFKEADSYFSKARNIDPVITEEYSYLASVENGTGRATEESNMKESIIFVEEE